MSKNIDYKKKLELFYDKLPYLFGNDGKDPNHFPYQKFEDIESKANDFIIFGRNSDDVYELNIGKNGQDMETLFINLEKCFGFLCEGRNVLVYTENFFMLQAIDALYGFLLNISHTGKEGISNVGTLRVHVDNYEEIDSFNNVIETFYYIRDVISFMEGKWNEDIVFAPNKMKRICRYGPERWKKIFPFKSVNASFSDKYNFQSFTNYNMYLDERAFWFYQKYMEKAGCGYDIGYDASDKMIQNYQDLFSKLQEDIDFFEKMLKERACALLLEHIERQKDILLKDEDYEI